MSRPSALAPLGASALYAAAALAFRGPPRSRERPVFRFLNDTRELPWLLAPQQLGTPWTLPTVAAIALVTGRRQDALVALLALPAEKAVEVATKKITRRPRPIHTQMTALRGDAPIDGPAFPSGHAAIATCATVLLAPHVPRPVAAALAASTAATAYVRVHQGAHYPSDVLGGVLLGVAVATGLSAAADRVFS